MLANGGVLTKLPETFPLKAMSSEKPEKGTEALVHTALKCTKKCERSEKETLRVPSALTRRRPEKEGCCVYQTFNEMAINLIT